MTRHAPGGTGSGKTADPRLITVRDWLRFAVSRLNEAGLSFGHGTHSALDEAAFLILHTLHLPIDTIDPWLDARLTAAECDAVANIVERRVTTRKPAAYLTGEAFMHGVPFTVDERVIVPRSFIGELLQGSLQALLPQGRPIHRILDLCTGSGCLAILSAFAFPDARIDATDISADALAVAKLNVHRHGLANRIRLLEGDLFQPVQGERYDLIVANPPYVADDSMSRFPPEHTFEPAMAHRGGGDGLDLIRRILADAHRRLSPQAVLVVECGDARRKIEIEYPKLPFLWPETEYGCGEVFALAAGDLTTRRK